MHTSKHQLKNYEINFPLERIAPLDKILFLDIETTGLRASNSRLYMIGLVYYTDGIWTIEQKMTQSSSEEKELLYWLAQTLPVFTHIIHFNGDHFDVPFLTQKANEYSVKLQFEHCEGIDIYKRIRPFKDLLILPDCRQKTIEQFLGINRVDKYSGGELIQIYLAYEYSRSKEMQDLLLQHNYDDMKGMLDIISVLAYSELCLTSVQVTKVELQRTQNVNGQKVLALCMSLKLPFSVPKKLFAHYDGNYISISEKKALLKVPVYESELKFFYANYKDYYYVPVLDAAYHKSIACQIDSSMRTQATPSNCYTRKNGFFLKQYDILVEPFFKSEYKDTVTYFEITEETKTNRLLFSNYSRHILQTIISHY